MIERIKDFILCLIPHWKSADMAVALDPYSENLSVVCDMNAVTEDERYDGWVHLPSIFHWLNFQIATIKGDVTVYPWGSWKQ